CFQNCGQHTLDAFPDGGEDLLYTSPRLIPVASEDPDEHVEESCDDTQNSLQHGGDYLKGTLEHRSQKSTEAIPDLLDGLDDVAEVDAKGRKPLPDAFDEIRHGILDPLPSAKDRFPELI